MPVNLKTIENEIGVFIPKNGTPNGVARIFANANWNRAHCWSDANWESVAAWAIAISILQYNAMCETNSSLFIIWTDEIDNYLLFAKSNSAMKNNSANNILVFTQNHRNSEKICLLLSSNLRDAYN